MNAMGTHARNAGNALMRSPLADNPLLLVVAGIGFSVSFQTITRIATHLGMPGWPVLYPIGIDVYILAMTLEARHLVSRKRSDIVPRVIAWALTALTVYINIHGSPADNWVGRTLHGVMPCLWVVFLELTRRRQKTDIRVDQSLEPIPLARWLADWPWRVAAMRRRQVLTRTKAYSVLCAREEARLLAISLARDVWGEKWKREAPVPVRHQLKQGTLPAEVSQAAEMAVFGPVSMAEPVEKWVTDALKQSAGAVARVRQQRKAVEPPPVTSPVVSPAVSATDSPDMPATRQPVTRPATSGREEAKRLLQETSMTLEEIATAAGVSLSTVNRVKKELPSRLRVAK
jgi:hypothetical protein